MCSSNFDARCNVSVNRAGAVPALHDPSLDTNRELSCAAIRERALTMMRDQAACWQDQIRPALTADAAVGAR